MLQALFLDEISRELELSLSLHFVTNKDEDNITFDRELFPF